MAVVLCAALLVTGIAAAAIGQVQNGIVVTGAGALTGAIAALVARRRLARFGDIEIVFWDVAGEQIYSAAAADYYTLMGHLVEARRRRADELGRGYAFAPVLICNPLALGTDDEGSPYERLRELVPLFAALDRETPQALVAINRWSVVDPICARGAPRDEVVTVSSRSRPEDAAGKAEVSRELVRAHCLDAEDGRDGDVRVAYLRYDTAIRADVEVDPEAATMAYQFDDGPGAFSGRARHRFLDWVVTLVKWPSVPQEQAVPVATTAVGSEPHEAPGYQQPLPDVWARPDASRPR